MRSSRIDSDKAAAIEFSGPAECRRGSLHSGSDQVADSKSIDDNLSTSLASDNSAIFSSSSLIYILNTSCHRCITVTGKSSDIYFYPNRIIQTLMKDNNIELIKNI